MRALAVGLGLAAVVMLTACQREGAAVSQSPASVRATRRAYDGSPPAIPHAPFGAACTSCHGSEAMQIAGVGLSPMSPHGDAVAGALQRCEQCHVYKQTEALFRSSTFAGVAQDLRKGPRLYDGAPPVMPHDYFMREQCAACHVGDRARAEIRCSHPERVRCEQCHVPATTAAVFSR